jgi:hypothetical protein
LGTTAQANGSAKFGPENSESGMDLIAVCIIIISKSPYRCQTACFKTGTPDRDLWAFDLWLDIAHKKNILNLVSQLN